MQIGFYGGKRCLITGASTAEHADPDDTAQAMDPSDGTLLRYGRTIVTDGQSPKTFTYDTETDAIAVMEHARAWANPTDR